MADEEPWGHLLSATETKSPIRLGKKTITIGRKSDCDVSFATNKLISSQHCSLSRDEDSRTWLIDTSTNGTLVNGRKVKKGEKIQINHNDQIHLIHRKKQPEDDIAYIFQDLKCLKAEFTLLDSTQEYDFGDTTETEEEEDKTNLAENSLGDVSDEMQPKSKKPKLDIDPESQQERAGGEKKSKSHNRDTMGEALVCGICQDIFHDCLSLQPCMHSFCCSCYSQWMDKSHECPSCRLPVKQMSRNHIVNNLVEAYLIDNPEKRRSAEELAEMDARNKITTDMIQPKKKKRNSFVESDSEIDTDESDSESEDEVSDEEDDLTFDSNISRSSWLMPSSFSSLFGFVPNIFRPSLSVCRWCPGFRSTTVISSVAGTGVAAGDNSSTTSSRTTSLEIAPGVPQPVCPDGMNHLMCLCCGKPMPKQEDLPRPHAGFTYAKSQKCGICSNFYCHLLWKCDRSGCRGCLNEFQDLDFDVSCLDVLILNNRYESQVLKNYLHEKGWSLQDLREKCLEKLDNKEYTTPDCVTKPDLGSKFILCHRCGLKNFKELAYQFRRDIPRADLPAAVTSRPDCHWGKNCRTQTNPSKPHHASRFNHVCEQTRFG